MTTRRVAAVDCGTNSLRLLVADVDNDGGMLVDRSRRTEIVRLGQGVDRTGMLAPEALERTRVVLAAYAAEIRELGVDSGAIRMVATSATRDASNRDDFSSMVVATLQVEPEVVTGEEEAGLSFVGATRDLLGSANVPAPYLVVDIGGGSTELVVGTTSVEAARSLDIGCVRLTERHLHSDPPTDAEVAALAADVERAMDVGRREVPLDHAASVVMVAGTATTITALALGLTEYDPARIHHARVTKSDVGVVTERLRHSTRAQIAAMPAVHPKRADVLTAGALVMRGVLDVVGTDSYVASEHDILDGIAWSLALP